MYLIQECGRVKEKDVDFYIMGGKKSNMGEFIFMVCFSSMRYDNSVFQQITSFPD